MACCLAAPSHYLNKCWLTINGVLWHSPNTDSDCSKYQLLKTRTISGAHDFITHAMHLQCIAFNAYNDSGRVGKFMHDVYHGIVPDIFEGMFVYNNMIHYHDTRISGHLHPPTFSSNLSQNSIRYHGVTIWNKILTAAINPDSSEVSFKIMLKKGIQQEVITHFD